MNGDDLLWAMQTLGFDDYIEPLKTYLAKYREAEKAALAAGNASKASAAGGGGGGDATAGGGG